MADDYPQPGLYKLVAEISSAMMPANNTYESEQCIEEHHFRTDPNAWMQQQPGQACEVVEYSLGAGKISMQLTCTIQGVGTSTITGTGTYTDTGFQMQNVMRMSSGGMTLETTTQVTGTRQGSC